MLQEWKVLSGTYDELKEWYESKKITIEKDIIPGSLRQMRTFEEMVSPGDLGMVKLIFWMKVMEPNEKGEIVMRIEQEKVCVVK